MSNEDLTLLIKNQLPEYSQSMQSSPIYRIDTNQTFSQNSSVSSDDLRELLND
jgi:hypothetical protein